MRNVSELRSEDGGSIQWVGEVEVERNEDIFEWRIFSVEMVVEEGAMRRVKVEFGSGKNECRGSDFKAWIYRGEEFKVIRREKKMKLSL